MVFHLKRSQLQRLSAKERIVLELYGQGLTADEIGEFHTHASTKTVSSQIASIKDKLGITSNPTFRIIAGLLHSTLQIQEGE